MVYEKKVLRELERALKKHKVRAAAIKAASEHSKKTKELVRLVLKGEQADYNDIIIFLDNYLKKHLKNLAKVSSNIGKY